MESVQLFPELGAYVQDLLAEADQIPPSRKKELARLGDFIRTNPFGVSRLNFICTHNSRRSHLAQIWTAVAAAYYGLSEVETYSGGTEATALNPRVVAALRRIGFQITSGEGPNPFYQIKFAEALLALRCWSKRFSDPANPTQDFAAIMTCSDADENCPFIPGAELRLPLTYDDPKVADDTPEESSRYDERTRQIGREVFFALGGVVVG